jgi:hypothetical protein
MERLTVVLIVLGLAAFVVLKVYAVRRFTAGQKQNTDRAKH